MNKNIPIRQWLLPNNDEDVAALIDQVMHGWKQKGTKTRRNWWDVLAGDKRGDPRVIEGTKFPVLKAAQLRKGVPITDNAICRNEVELFPDSYPNGRWGHR